MHKEIKMIFFSLHENEYTVVPLRNRVLSYLFIFIVCLLVNRYSAYSLALFYTYHIVTLLTTLQGQGGVQISICQMHRKTNII